MSASRLRAGWVLGGLLILALVVLGIILARGLPERAPGPATDAARPPDGTGSPTPPATPQSAEGALVPLPTVDPTLAAIVRPSLPEEWASAVLDITTEHLDGVSQAAHADFMWWQEKEHWGPLAQAAGGITIGGQVVALDELATIEVVLPAAPGLDGLESVGRIEYQDNTLSLRLTGQGKDRQSVRSLSGGVLPGDAVAALVQGAEERDLVLVAAYWEGACDCATLVLIEVVPAAQATQLAEATPTETPTPGTPPVVTPTLTPSPTLIYEPDVRLMFEAQLVQFIEDARRAADLRRETVDNYVQNHAWAGTLTWAGEGPRVAGRSLEWDTSAVQELTLFGLVGEDPAPAPTAFLRTHWDGYGTTVTNSAGDSQWYYGFRLAEVVHWMILVAEEQGGQLTVAYDDIGGHQALTVVDFQPLPLPPGG